ncbi:MATE family efflux transporter [Novosphingobium panipatense]|uniref:MATE family efflux transporter n=1 Tax=Novosphingobium TaxID=165696 RepID=UPI001E2CC5C8|nr:MATE family efflux transporter [Novosphingobium sp. HII-3]
MNMSRQLWSLALPAMLTNVATALFGLADMWAIGRLGDAPAQGAVELGAKFMLGLLNVFNFLRTSTVALTAQGSGRGDTQAGATLVRAAGVSLAIGLVLLVAMPLTIPLGLDLLGAEGAVRTAASRYIEVRYWAGPVWLLNCVLVGWMIGRRKVRQVLAVEIIANVVHIALDLLLVLVAGWGVTGVAVATLASELLKFALLAVLMTREGAVPACAAAIRRRSTWARQELAPLFALNRDLFVRTLLLTGSILLFARTGAEGGPVTLAANGVLFQLFMLSTLLLDGFESGAQVLCGEASGAGSRRRFTDALKAALVSGGAMGLVVAIVYALAGPALAGAFSTDPQVIAATARYAPWIALLPLLGVCSFVFDGAFVGAGWTRAMLGTMTVAIAAYLVALAALRPLGNHGLWAAFAVLFASRALAQAAVLPGLVRRSFSAS